MKAALRQCKPLRTLGLGLIVMAATAVPASAETWTAGCHSLEFRFDRTNKKASIFMKSVGAVAYEVATGTIALDNGTALRAVFSPPPMADDDPIIEVGLNKSRKIVYLVRHRSGSNDVKDGVFCETPIQVSGSGN